MKLFLTSSGLPPETTEAFLGLLDKDPKEATVCLIANAADSYKDEDKWFVVKDKERLRELGFKITEIDLKKEDENSLTDKFEVVDVVFVEGGNTFYLMKYMRESGFDKAIRRFLDRGGIYLGVSAGSYVACPDIFPAQWKHAEDQNKVGLKDFKGLGLVSFYVSLHYVPDHEAIINDNKDKVSSMIFALTDFQAILVNRYVRFVGPGEVKEFHQDKPQDKPEEIEPY